MSSDHPGVIAPPPLIFATFLAAGWAAGWDMGIPAAWRCALGLLLILAAAAMLTAALGLFRRARTRPEPWQPTTAIVDRGIYGLTRNPMYVGMALAYAGIAVLADSGTALLLLPAVLLVIHFGVVLREERYLERKFGADYLGYKGRVRRWL